MRPKTHITFNWWWAGAFVVSLVMWAGLIACGVAILPQEYNASQLPQRVEP